MNNETFRVLLNAASDGCGSKQYLLSDIDQALEDNEISARQAERLVKIVHETYR